MRKTYIALVMLTPMANLNGIMLLIREVLPVYMILATCGGIMHVSLMKPEPPTEIVQMSMVGFGIVGGAHGLHDVIMAQLEVERYKKTWSEDYIQRIAVREARKARNRSLIRPLIFPAMGILCYTTAVKIFSSFSSQKDT